MEISFLGGAGEVGRSAILLKGEKNILLDNGIKLDHKTEYPLETGRVDAFVLSHAHLDHSGSAPSLYRSSFPVAFGTAPTLELSELLIEDSMKIARRNHSVQRFTKTQLNSFKSKYLSYDYGAQIDYNGHYITLYDAGHISGSSITLIENAKTDRRLVYTGDFKIDPQVLQGSADIIKSDILIIESTYANKEHPDRSELIRQFIEDVKETIDNGGTALIPCFAVGRSQEILAILYKNGLIDYTYVDGMAKKAASIVMRHPEFTRNSDVLMKALKNSVWVDEMHERKKALNAPSIIVTTSGMLTGGPVLDYITKLNPKSKVMLTGYQIEGTNGRNLMENKPIIIDGRKYSIKLPVSFYDFSAHAGATDLHEYVRKSNPEHVICVHGDPKNTKLFAETLNMQGFTAHAPNVGEKINLEF